MLPARILKWFRRLALRHTEAANELLMEAENLEERMMLSSPDVWINPIGTQLAGEVTISGTAEDDLAVNRNRSSLYNLDTEQYWNGSEWSDDWALFEPNGLEDWSYTVDLAAGIYRVTARSWDDANNRDVASRLFSVVKDETAPDVWINPIGIPMSGTVTISGTAVDDVAVDRNRASLYNLETEQYWNGVAWTDEWALFEPVGNENWSYTLDLAEGTYRTTARSWDAANNRDVASRLFSVEGDQAPPDVWIRPLRDSIAGPVTLSGTSVDNVGVVRNRLTIYNLDTEQFWNGSEWSDQWAQIAPVGNRNWSYNLDLDAGTYRVIARSWDESGNRDAASRMFLVDFDPDDFSNQVVEQLNEVLPDDWNVQSSVRNGNIWFRTFAPDGSAKFDVRIGSAGVIAEIRDIDTSRNLLAPSFNHEVTDRVVQWTMWEFGNAVRHDVPSLPDFEDRFNVTQAGTFENVLNGTVDVDLNLEQGQIDVWSVVDNNWKSEQDPHMDGTITALTRTEVLDGGAILVRRVIRIGEINLNGQTVSLAAPYFEAWSPFSDSVFNSMALGINANGNPNNWFADGINIPHYPHTPVENTRGWAVSYNRDNLADGPTMSVVFGKDKGTVHRADGATTTSHRYNLNSMDFNGGMAILPGLLPGSLSEGAIIDQHLIFMPGNGIDGSTAAQLDALAGRLPPPQVYHAGAELDGELFAIADRLSSLKQEPRSATNNLGTLI